MVKDEGALRFVSMDEEEEKRLKIIQAILQQILSLQQLPLGITLDQGSPPSSDVFQILISPVHPKFSVPAKHCRPPSPLQTTWLEKDLGEPIQVPAQRSHCFGIWANCHQEGNQSSTFSLPLDAISEEKGYFWCKDSNSCRRVGIETRQTCTRYNTHHSSSAIRSHPIRQLVSEIQKAKKVIFKVQRWKAGETRSSPQNPSTALLWLKIYFFDPFWLHFNTDHIFTAIRQMIHSEFFYFIPASILVCLIQITEWYESEVWDSRKGAWKLMPGWIHHQKNTQIQKSSLRKKKCFWSAIHWSNQPTSFFPEYNLQWQLSRVSQIRISRDMIKHVSETHQVV